MTSKSSKVTMQDPSTSASPAEFSMSSNTQQILTYMDDTSMQSASLPGITTPLPTVLASGHEVRKHTIEDILSRPVKIIQASWLPTFLPNAELAKAVFPDILLQKPQISSKMQNFTLLRADICIRVLVNSMPFQAGKLLAYFSPLPQYVGERAKANDFLASKCVFPHILLDAAVGNTAELRIPYVNPYNHYNLTNSTNNMGTFFLDVFNKVRSATPPVVPVTVFAWFENIDLGVPTSAALVIPPPPMVAQSFDEQDEKSEKGILTDVTGTFAAFSRSAEGLPLVGHIFEPITWIAKALNRTASAFGLCKPSSVAAPVKYLNVPGAGYTHGEGLSQGNMLATKADNQLQMRTDVFGSTVDEMDISYLCNHTALFRQFEWSFNSPENINEFHVSPMTMDPIITTIDTVDYTYYEPTMLNYVTAAFHFWRGALKYKIQVAKTAFHSGRLRISYIPGGQLGNNYDYDLSYSWILDLRVSNQIEFEVPFTSVVPWVPAIIPDETNPTSANGILVISVLNPLVFAGAVDPTVDVNVWVGAGSDFQLAKPTASEFIPIRLPAPPMVAQVGEETQDPGFMDFTPAAKMFEMESADPVALEALSIGEHVTNVRTIIKRSAIKYFGDLINFENSVTLNAQDFGILTQIDEQDISQLPTPLDYFSYLYRFARGGLDWKIFSRNGTFLKTIGGTKGFVKDEAQVRTTITNKYGGGSITPFFQSSIDFTNFDSGNFTHTTFTSLNPVHEVVAPHFINVGIIPIIGLGADFTDLPFIAYKELVIAYEASLRSNADLDASRSRIEVWKAAGDDLQFGWVVGPPRIAAYTGVKEPSWTPTP